MSDDDSQRVSYSQRSDSLDSRSDTNPCLSVFLGFAVIVVGWFLSIALRDPGGSRVSLEDARIARMVAYLAFVSGAFFAVIIPAVSIALCRTEARSEAIVTAGGEQ